MLMFLNTNEITLQIHQIPDCNPYLFNCTINPACDYFNPFNKVPAIIIVIKCNQIKDQWKFWPAIREQR